MPPTIKIKKLHPDAIVPERKSSGAAGFDIYSIEEVKIEPGEIAMISTGIALELPENMVAYIFPRGSLCLKKHLDMPHSIGVGDEDFRGEYKVVYRNLGEESVTFEKHERIAQFVFMNYIPVEFKEVDELSDTSRGTGGFGSTGKK